VYQDVECKIQMIHYVGRFFGLNALRHVHKFVGHILPTGPQLRSATFWSTVVYPSADLQVRRSRVRILPVAVDGRVFKFYTELTRENYNNVSNL